MTVCADALRLPYLTGSAHAAITSPPYWGLRDYPILGASWPAVSYSPMPGLPPVEIPAGAEPLGWERDPYAYIGHLVLIFREARRVLRDDGVLAVNISDCYTARRGQSFRRSLETAGKQASSYPRADPLAQPQGLSGGLPPKCLMMIPARLALAMVADGWVLRSRMPTGLEIEPDILWTKPAAMCRSAGDRPTEDFEDVLLFSQQRRYCWDLVNALEPYRGEVRASKASKSAMLAQAALRPRGNLNSKPEESGERFYSRGGRNWRAAWPVVAEKTGLPHYAAYPSALVRRILSVTTADAGACSECGAQWRRDIESVRCVDGQPVEDLGQHGNGERPSTAQGIGHWRITRELIDKGWGPACDCGAEPGPCRVLDLFAGIGRTDEACRQTGRRYMGSDLSPEYCQLHRWRLAEDVDQRPRRARAMPFEGPLLAGLE